MLTTTVIAGEARDPRRTVPRAFSTIVMRLIVFFIGGCLCVGGKYLFYNRLKDAYKRVLLGSRPI